MIFCRKWNKLSTYPLLVHKLSTFNVRNLFDKTIKVNNLLSQKVVIHIVVNIIYGDRLVGVVLNKKLLSISSG